MATTFWFPNTASDIDPGADLEKAAILTQPGPVLVQAYTTNTVSGPTAGVQLTNGAGSTPVCWFSAPLAAVTISGTITFNVYGQEGAMAANVGAQCKIERCDGSGSVISTVIDSEKGTELPTSEAAQNWTGSPTSTTLSDGDRLKFTWMGNDGGGTMASGNTFYFRLGSDTVAGVGDSWVQFTETITVYTAPAAVPAGPHIYPQLLAH